MISCAATLSISISRVSLDTRLHTKAGHQCLRFFGTVLPSTTDFPGDMPDVASALAGHTAEIVCAPRPGKSEKGATPGCVGCCQFSVLAGGMPLQAEVTCCPKLFHVLKNAVAFGNGCADSGLAAILHLAEDGEAPFGSNRAVTRLAVTDMTLRVDRRLAAPFVEPVEPAGLARARPAFSGAMPL